MKTFRLFRVFGDSCKVVVSHIHFWCRDQDLDLPEQQEVLQQNRKLTFTV